MLQEYLYYKVSIRVKVYLPLDFYIVWIQLPLLVKTLIVPLQCHSGERSNINLSSYHRKNVTKKM